MKTPYVINIQKYSVHDGDGIRTTIFFKGCMLNCWWCHNPESQRYTPDVMFDKEKCTGCSYCAHACKHGAITISEEGKAVTDMTKCVMCEDCLEYCPQNNREIVGRQYEIKDLVKIAERDMQFYEESNGGVTLSGGEVMSQDMDYIVELVKALKAKGFNVAIDTCGYAPKENYERILPYADTFLYDVKTMDDEVHKKYMGQSNKKILENLKFLADNHANINIRIPVVEPVNSDVQSMTDIINFLKSEIGITKVNLLPYHNTGSSKYERLGREYPARELKTPTNEHMEMLKNLFIKNGFNNVKIGG